MPYVVGQVKFSFYWWHNISNSIFFTGFANQGLAVPFIFCESGSNRMVRALILADSITVRMKTSDILYCDTLIIGLVLILVC
jgi:hypothetical protein